MDFEANRIRESSWLLPNGNFRCFLLTPSSLCLCGNIFFSVPSSPECQLNLRFHAIWGHFHREVECLDAVLKFKGATDQRLNVDLARTHQRQGSRINVSIPEHRLNGGFLGTKGHNIQGYRPDGQSNQDDPAPWAKRFRGSLNGWRCPAGFENDVSAPSVGELVNDARANSLWRY